MSGRLIRPLIVVLAFGIDLWVWGGDAQTLTGGDVAPWVVVAVMAVGYAPLALWRSPLPGYAALWVLALATVLVPAVESFAGFLVALFLMARLTAPPLPTIALVGSAVPIAVNTLTGVAFHEDADAFFVALNLALWSALMLGVWAAGRVFARGAKRLETERSWAEDTRREALAVERVRMSREIHDTVAHGLSGIVLRAAGARVGLSRKTASEQDIEEALASIQDVGEQSMRELHRLLGMMRGRDSTGGDGTEDGPLDAGEGRAQYARIEDLVEAARSAGLDVSTRQEGEPAALDPSVAHTMYRVTQEALSNVMKHGGAGARVNVETRWLQCSVSIAVQNSGGIIDPAEHPAPSGGFGLAGLRERVSMSGGTLQAGATVDGYAVRAELPTGAQSVASSRRTIDGRVANMEARSEGDA